MSLSLIIATYNRPVPVVRLVKEVLLCADKPCQIIVVDSSDEVNQQLSLDSEVTYVRSSHKNQPYQRYLGYLVAQQDWIIFLDDDLDFLDYSFFTDVLFKINSLNISGISVGIDYQNIISEKINSNVKTSSKLFRIINFLSGVPIRKRGKIYLAGLVGPHPQTEGQVEYFNGPVMVFKKSALVNCFDAVLFSLFERNLAMGEDKAISMQLGLSQKLWFLPKKYFNHPPVQSHYFKDIRSFQKKTSYSRLYLSLVYARAAKGSKLLAYSHYYYYMGWRIIIAALRIISNPSKQNIQLFQGHLDGLTLTFKHNLTVGSLTPFVDWQNELKNDIERYRER